MSVDWFHLYYTRLWISCPPTGLISITHLDVMTITPVAFMPTNRFHLWIHVHQQVSPVDTCPPTGFTSGFMSTNRVLPWIHAHQQVLPVDSCPPTGFTCGFMPTNRFHDHYTSDSYAHQQVPRLPLAFIPTNMFFVYRCLLCPPTCFTSTSGCHAHNKFNLYLCLS